MRINNLAALIVFAISLMGCGGQPTIDEGPRPVAAGEIDRLTGQLKTSEGMALTYAIKRLGELGPEAKSAVPALKDAKRRARPGQKTMIDESIAKIEGAAPAAGPPAS